LVQIWLPADAHRRLSEALPQWSLAHKVLDDAGETKYALGVRRVSCDASTAQVLLELAEHVYPESAQLIRIAIRKAGSIRSTRGFVPPVPPTRPRRARGRRPKLAPVRRVATVSLLLFTFQVLQWIDRGRDLLRRLL
jgi:hypothetical protein